MESEINSRLEPVDGEHSTNRSRWWARPDRRVAALTVLMGVATVGFIARMLVVGLPHARGAHTLLWLPVLLVLFLLTEGFAIHIRVRRGGHAISVTEIPMVLALVFVDPLLAEVNRLSAAPAQPQVQRFDED